VEEVPVTRDPSILRPSIRLLTSVIAKASENALVSRMSASYCERVKLVGAASAARCRSTANNSCGLRTWSTRKITSLRRVNTTATSPRPSATVVTIVRDTSGARRIERPV
jgi:hypothetical protein